MKTIITILLVLTSVCLTLGQDFQPGKLLVSIVSDEARAVNDSATSNEEINSIFTHFNVYSYRQIMGFAKTPSLRDIYEISCDCDESQLNQELMRFIPDFFSFVEPVYEPVMLYDPEDGAWKVWHSSWHLKNIRADSAWEITIGNPQIRVAVIDQPPDVAHPDLATKIFPHYNPLNGVQYHAIVDGDSIWSPTHGTPVSSFVAAATAEEGDTLMSPNGYLASIGFKTKLINYSTTNLVAAVHASTVMGVDVISISWGSHCGPPSYYTGETYKAGIKEILDNGTVIVVAAGNGCMISCYNDSKLMKDKCDNFPPEFQYYSPFYPFHPSYDERIIVVTSTDSLDNHMQINPVNGDTITHSQFTAVDICAPGYDIAGATNTLRMDSLGNIVPKDWPYLPFFGGTSFSTPIVAGLCGLIKSVNPCLTPEQVEYILKQTADPVTDENLYSGLLGTGRINAYQAVKYAQENYGYEEYVIRRELDTTWTTDVQAKKIIVEWGARLTIRSTVYMLPGSDIIVEKGGTLVVDGGHITTCKGLWNGIQVRGDRFLNQFSYYNQGHLTLVSGAIIENAKVGVLVAESDGIKLNPNKTGGIVQALDASFINCVTGVAFYPYENFHSSITNVMDNLSYLKFCNFRIDSNYHHVFFTPRQFILMENIRGIKISGCNFISEISASGYDEATQIDPDKMIGIMSISASYTVDDYCPDDIYPCDSAVPCHFEKLNYGIYALNWGSEKFPRIEQSEFLKNRTGIYLSAVNNAELISNYFFLLDVDTLNNENPVNVGIYLDHCNAYKVEENLIDGYEPINLSGVKIGLVVNNSGPYPNEIYKNYFSHLDYGIIAMNENKRDSVGLCIQCNNFSYCNNDVSVVIDSTIRGWGIAQYQGSREDTTTAPAGNVFTSNYMHHEWDLYNDDLADPFTYFHHNENLNLDYNVQPDDYSLSVSPILNDQQYYPDRSCPSRLDEGRSLTAEKTNIFYTEGQINSTINALDLLIDGGDTQNLTSEVLSCTPPDALDITQQLLGESPYLSDTVMKSAIVKEDVLTNAMIRDILMENPQSAKSAGIMQMLDERTEPMPQYMKEQIEEGRFNTGDKENLEATRSFYLLEKQRAVNNLNRIFQSDSTIVNRTDSLAWLFDQVSSPETRYRKALTILESGDTAWVAGILNSIPSDFSFTTEQLNVHEKYENLLVIIKDIGLSSGSITTLDSAGIAGLLEINDNVTLPGIYARNILVAAGYLTYEEPYSFPNYLKRGHADPITRKDSRKEDIVLKVFPNPASFYTIIGYDASDTENPDASGQKIIIKVRDVRGIIVKTLHSEKSTNQLVLDVRNFKPGLYFIELLINGHRKATTKMIFNR